MNIQKSDIQICHHIDIVCIWLRDQTEFRKFVTFTFDECHHSHCLLQPYVDNKHKQAFDTANTVIRHCIDRLCSMRNEYPVANDIGCHVSKNILQPNVKHNNKFKRWTVHSKRLCYRKTVTDKIHLVCRHSIERCCTNVCIRKKPKSSTTTVVRAVYRQQPKMLYTHTHTHSDMHSIVQHTSAYRIELP